MTVKLLIADDDEWICEGLETKYRLGRGRGRGGRHGLRR